MFEFRKIAVIGLGYVGLPLAVALSRSHEVVGYDTSAERVSQLLLGEDRTGEVRGDALVASELSVTADPKKMEGSDVFIVTVPTPIDTRNQPDLRPILEATRTVAAQLREGGIVVYESTVYPGVTEEQCAPVLSDISGLTCGEEFWLGYSPERINPGDPQHSIENIVKVVAGQTEDVTEALSKMYGAINGGKVFAARDIRTAEAAKVIENAQRDINIAFVNEIAMIFNRLGLSTLDVLDAARTKWNFLDFRPGLVGGHCIGVDPFYLAHKAQAAGINPEVILAGRRINDGMGALIGDLVAADLVPGSRIIILGVTFKENVPDIRNTRVIDIVERLESSGFHVDIHDPRANPADVRAIFERDLVSINAVAGYQAIVIAVNHREFYSLDDEVLLRILSNQGMIFDLKGIFRHRNIPSGIQIKTL